MDIIFHEMSGYLVVEISGSWDLDDAKQQIEAIQNRANQLGIARVLIDCRNLAAPKNTTTRFLTGEHIAKFWRPPIKVAAVGSPGMISDKFAETVAVNRGAWFSAFLEEEKALRWLMEGSDGLG